MKTSGVKALVREVLESLPSPHSEHVIDEAFATIESSPGFRARYQALCDTLGKSVVNNWCGQWIAHVLGKTGQVQVASRRSTLIGSYSLLDADAIAAVRKPDEAEARQLMYAYFQANRVRLPTTIQVHRDAIIELVMAGVTPQAAFSAVLQPDVDHATNEVK